MSLDLCTRMKQVRNDESNFTCLLGALAFFFLFLLLFLFCCTLDCAFLVGVALLALLLSPVLLSCVLLLLLLVQLLLLSTTMLAPSCDCVMFVELLSLDGVESHCICKLPLPPSTNSRWENIIIVVVFVNIDVW